MITNSRLIKNQDNKNVADLGQENQSLEAQRAFPFSELPFNMQSYILTKLNAKNLHSLSLASKDTQKNLVDGHIKMHFVLERLGLQERFHLCLNNLQYAKALLVSNNFREQFSLNQLLKIICNHQELRERYTAYVNEIESSDVAQYLRAFEQSITNQLSHYATRSKQRQLTLADISKRFQTIEGCTESLDDKDCKNEYLFHLNSNEKFFKCDVIIKNLREYVLNTSVSEFAHLLVKKRFSILFKAIFSEIEIKQHDKSRFMKLAIQDDIVTADELELVALLSDCGEYKDCLSLMGIDQLEYYINNHNLSLKIFGMIKPDHEWGVIEALLVNKDVARCVIDKLDTYQQRMDSYDATYPSEFNALVRILIIHPEFLFYKSNGKYLASQFSRDELVDILGATSSCSLHKAFIEFIEHNSREDKIINQLLQIFFESDYLFAHEKVDRKTIGEYFRLAKECKCTLYAQAALTLSSNCIEQQKEFIRTEPLYPVINPNYEEYDWEDEERKTESEIQEDIARLKFEVECYNVLENMKFLKKENLTQTIEKTRAKI